VRSSATAEDSSGLSFAGIFESIAIDGPEDLEGAVREVWASAFSPRALSYARERGLQALPEMAVVVQRFLEAERSGVMFTRFAGPAGDEQILIEHVEGGCEKLVKGEVTPDRLWIELGSAPAEEATADQGLLGRHASELAALAESLESDFGGPQDVEWCIQSGSVHVVQSRPITASFRSAETVDLAPDASPILSGVPASGGIGTGEVHLVFNIEQALRLQRGQVLVTPMTNPDMVVAMRNSAAIVTDVGGMICHAAIVSRELGLPCVVGTEVATTTLDGGLVVTVDGFSGSVYEGRPESVRNESPRRPAEWPDLWRAWGERTDGATPVALSALEAVATAPIGVEEVVFVPEVELRMGPQGLWNDLEGLAAQDRAASLDAFCGRIAAAATEGEIRTLWVRSPAGSLARDLRAAVERLGDPRIRMEPNEASGSDGDPGPSRAVPMALALATAAPTVGPPEDALAAALDTLKFFGHRPGTRVAPMPDTASRRRWWEVLPEYGRYHAEFGSEHRQEEFEWLEVRPELVISALLKSLVQPGFEMVPRVLGFPGLGPMHIKWIRCRYHFRADTFARTWEAIVRGTWDRDFMVDMLRRVRRSYDHLEEVLLLFPRSNEELEGLSGQRLAALITSWWPRWVEFFALCWFIQAQGDDVAYPFVEETVADNLRRLPDPPGDLGWPSAPDLVAPTTPVMSGDYMASVGRFREALLAAGLTSREAAEEALGDGGHPDVRSRLDDHLRDWHWMRDRDLLFEPWDTPGRVIETALRTEPHAAVPYSENRRRNLLALSLHVDLAQASGRGEALNRMARFLHDLNVERENHHVLWLKFSYPLRRVVLEIERRLVEAGGIAPGDIFFLQAPELIEAARRLPAALPDDLAARVKNRRLGYLVEARLAPDGHPEPTPEDDYY